MAITQTFVTSCKAELLGAIHDFDTDTFKIALYTSAATLGAATTVYATTNEVVGTGYSAGGATLSGGTITTSGTGACATFNDPVWANSTLTARGALIYNSSKSNRAVCVLDFGADKVTASTNFSVIMPVATLATALIQVA
jgi:hypothetical protein